MHATEILMKVRKCLKYMFVSNVIVSASVWVISYVTIILGTCLCPLAEYRVRVRVSVVHDLSCRLYSPSTSDIEVEPK